jgi:glycosyltransferase involved in cell wall biosynthesis
MKIASTPLVSVVIPTFNRAHELERALKSVQSQTFFNWEILIVDNFSNDNTDDIVSRFNDSRMKLLKISNNGVIAASRNMGVNHAVGEYIAFLDSDDWWKPNKLSLCLKAIDDGADIVYHDLYVVKKLHRRLFRDKVRSGELKRPVFDYLLAHGNRILNSSVMVKKNLLIEIGGISEDKDLIASEDFDTWLRISLITEKFKRIPDTLGYYWLGGGNTSSEEKYIKIIQVIKKMYSLEMQRLMKNYNFYWMNYALGRYYFKRRDFNSAIIYLGLIGFRKSPSLIYCKSQLMLLPIKLLRVVKLIN